jgi:hypothetical protein
VGREALDRESLCHAGSMLFGTHGSKFVSVSYYIC